MLIVTGLAGAGKTTAMHTLEDMGYYCIDNLPSNMLAPLVDRFAAAHPQPVAVAIDSRDLSGISHLPSIIKDLRDRVNIQILFLTADDETLVRRFSETRRPHPAHTMAHQEESLPQAIANERQLLGNLFDLAEITIDTSRYNLYRLKDRIRQLLSSSDNALKITLQSFGFKHGTPVNADYLFDVRFLPNPHWDESLRPFSGQDKPVAEFLAQYSETQGFIEHSSAFLSYCLPQFIKSGHRAYLTISIGCTGGQHRSVYIVETLAKILGQDFPNIIVEHRDKKLA
ncbi:RNase adapter RapZ [Suttonella sp. R2A3]|uniref:RNase adapter RapZ n=1 Tax=Suttonella sp. R2A3 TaxID=2908648 RepID=UPI001F3D89E1|nr:RNase adapter RapZ [Suttonella sp. R2A3]UJF25306.1 RNase adapter RapZ [Suttonella sp. R2A3]